MKKIGVIIVILGALCIVSGLVDPSYIGAQILKALSDFAMFLSGSSFGMKNTTLFLYGGIVVAFAGLAMIFWGRQRSHRL